jgi:hypothetical protein
MSAYRTGRESAATIHSRPSPTFAGAQVRALNALLARVYGERIELDTDLVRAWAALINAWPAVAEQDPPQPE